MKFNSLVISATLFASFVITSCAPTYPKCENDKNCSEKGEVCVQGMCQECAVDANCKPGFVCDANKCVPKPECRADSECGSDKKCHAGKCTVAKDPNAKVVKTCSKTSECGVDEECKEGICSTKSLASSCEFSAVPFDFNEAQLSDEARAKLSNMAECIKKNRWKLRLEGNADERGTEEYNLQLSNRRATSVRKYLVDLGVNATDLETIGYGENKPVAQGSSESAWAANRRVDLVKR